MSELKLLDIAKDPGISEMNQSTYPCDDMSASPVLGQRVEDNTNIYYPASHPVPSDSEDFYYYTREVSPWEPQGDDSTSFRFGGFGFGHA